MHVHLQGGMQLFKFLRCAVDGMHRGIMKKCNQRPFTVLVEGNIGSGKTTFLNHFQDTNALVLSEPVELWRNANGHNLLGLMYEDPVRWGLTFQSYVQLTMMNFHIIPSPHPLKILERSLFSARYCFVENLARQGLMPPCELTVLDEWFKWIVSHMDISADLIVYLHTKPEVVLERIKVRERKEECSVSLEYLQQLHKLHEEWLCNTETPVIVVDANPGIDEMQGEFSRYKSLILEKAASHLTKENKSIEKLPQSERPKILEGEPEVSAAQ